MQIGLCCGPDRAVGAADAGFDFIEWNVGGLLQPHAGRAAFQAALRQVRAAPLPCPVVNCFVPAGLTITGPAADLSVLKQYVTLVFERAEEAGVRMIVFGSGGARRVPEGYDPGLARTQLVAFGRMFAPIAERHGVTVVIEPLSRAECNILTTVDESADLVRDVDHPALRLLVDAYHFTRDQDSLDSLDLNARLLAHVHLATVPSRLAPGMEPCDFAPFFNTLRAGGYTGGVSFEGQAPDSPADLARAASIMRVLADASD
jgi:sugar phosphate isomerase/epimerase